MLDALYAVFEGLGLIDDATSNDGKRRRSAGLLGIAVGCAVIVGLGLVYAFWLWG